MNYSLINLLKKTDDGSIKGPMSPVLAAQEFSKAMGMPIHRLVRVAFDDNRMLQKQDGTEGITGHDVLIIGTNLKKGGTTAGMFIDMGTALQPVAYYDDELVVAPVFRRACPEFLAVPSDQTIEAVLRMVIDNAEALNPGKSSCVVFDPNTKNG